MNIYVDSREKWTQDGNDDTHIKDYFERHNINYAVKKLDVGDYQIEGKTSISIDRKKNLEELAKNLMNKKDHSRFWKEVRRAKEQKTKLIILCEHGGKIKDIKSVSQWKSKYSPVNGRQLMEEIYKVHIAYGIDFLFCSKRSTGKKIIELLNN
ncbi:MAG: ERCC4 domain-containing protein [Paludibacteraceae bacterium]|nr:ERCC4 domain-containing protein [Paludibacteraceae bacterium]